MGFKSMIIGSALAAGMAVAGANVAVAGVSADSATPNEQAARPDPSRRVCRMTSPTGSRLSLRSCRTQAEWDEQRQRSQQGMEDQARNDETVRPGAGVATGTLVGSPR